MGDARAAFEKARAADRKYVQPCLGLAWLAVQERKWREAANYAGEAIKLNPFDFVEAYLLRFHKKVSGDDKEKITSDPPGHD